MNFSIRFNSDPQNYITSFLDVVLNYQWWVPGLDDWRISGGSSLVADMTPDGWEWFTVPHTWEQAISLQGHRWSTDDEPSDIFWLYTGYGSGKMSPADLQEGDSRNLSIFGIWPTLDVPLGPSPTWVVLRKF